MSGNKFLILACLLITFNSIKAGTGYVFFKDTVNKLFYLNNNEVYTDDKNTLLFFQKGNIIFGGSNDDRSNIYLLASSMNVNSDNLELLYEKDNRRPTYSFTHNKFYLGKNENEQTRDQNELIRVERAKKWLAFYSSYNDSLVAFYAADSAPSFVCILVAYTLTKKLHLEGKVKPPPAQPTFEEGAFSTLKPMSGNATANEWMWDGKVLRPRWNVDTRLMWTFDGQTAKPLYGTNIYDQYSWDGETLRPAWKTDNSKEWTYDGTQIKPVWGTDWADQYIIENEVVKPWSGVHPEHEWKMNGNIPIPVLILVLSGIARPY